MGKDMMTLDASAVRSQQNPIIISFHKPDYWLLILLPFALSTCRITHRYQKSIRNPISTVWRSCSLGSPMAFPSPFCVFGFVLKSWEPPQIPWYESSLPFKHTLPLSTPCSDTPNYQIVGYYIAISRKIFPWFHGQFTQRLSLWVAAINNR